MNEPDTESTYQAPVSPLTEFTEHQVASFREAVASGRVFTTPDESAAVMCGQQVQQIMNRRFSELLKKGVV
jgi:hypothetical protein